MLANLTKNVANTSQIFVHFLSPVNMVKIVEMDG